MIHPKSKILLEVEIEKVFELGIASILLFELWPGGLL
jgi:hypothetical protein